MDIQNGCANRCCFMIPFGILLQYREEYFRLTENQRLLYIFNFLKLNMLSAISVTSNLPFRFHINGTNVCKKCWCSVYHISKQKFNHAYD